MTSPLGLRNQLSTVSIAFAPFHPREGQGCHRDHWPPTGVPSQVAGKPTRPKHLSETLDSASTYEQNGPILSISHTLWLGWLHLGWPNNLGTIDAPPRCQADPSANVPRGARRLDSNRTSLTSGSRREGTLDECCKPSVGYGAFSDGRGIASSHQTGTTALVSRKRPRTRGWPTTRPTLPSRSLCHARCQEPRPCGWKCRIVERAMKSASLAPGIKRLRQLFWHFRCDMTYREATARRR